MSTTFVQDGTAMRHAYEIGRATLTLAGGQLVSPRYVVVWKHEDGAWRRRVDIWNMDAA